jgi:hypothetical protein
LKPHVSRSCHYEIFPVIEKGTDELAFFFANAEPCCTKQNLKL